MSTPALSVVIPTYNRRTRLARVLRSLADQTIDVPFEVVVVSDGSTDGTESSIEALDLPIDLRCFHQENRGPAAARNRGVQAARGELIVFVDDDVVAHPNLLADHWQAHGANSRLVTIGPMVDPDDHHMSVWVQWEQTMLAKQYADMADGKYPATARQFYTGNAAVRRCHLAEVGGFDESFRRAEDVELAYRLEGIGLDFEFRPDAIGYHYAERSYQSWRDIAYTYGRNDVVFARDRGQDWIYGFIAEQIGEHRRPLPTIIRISATRPVMARLASRLVGDTAVALGRTHFSRVPRYLLSAVYAIEYHRGVADELADPAAFRRLASAAR